MVFCLVFCRIITFHFINGVFSYLYGIFFARFQLNPLFQIFIARYTNNSNTFEVAKTFHFTSLGRSESICLSTEIGLFLFGTLSVVLNSISFSFISSQFQFHRHILILHLNNLKSKLYLSCKLPSTNILLPNFLICSILFKFMCNFCLF